MKQATLHFQVASLLLWLSDYGGTRFDLRLPCGTGAHAASNLNVGSCEYLPTLNENKLPLAGPLLRVLQLTGQ